MIKPQEVIAEFSRLTGIKFRTGILPYDVGIQATKLAKLFQLWELRPIVELTKAKIREGQDRRNGFTNESLQWHCMIAGRADEELTRFQQRLSLAMEWAKRSRPSLIPRDQVEPEPQKPATVHQEQPAAPGNVDPRKVSELKKKLMGK